MAIGSAPEIGLKFVRFGDLTPEQQQQFFDYQKTYGEHGLNGYAILAYPKNAKPCPPLAKLSQ